MRLWVYDPITSPMVNVFREQSFDIGIAGLLGPGQYNYDSFWNHHMQPNRIKGLTIPANMWVSLYSEDNFRGDRKDIIGPYRADFAHDNDLNRWYEAIRSMYVY